MPSAEPIWVLQGPRLGDNRQLLAIADALPHRYRTVQLEFNRLAAVPYIHALGTQLTWRADVPLGPPWPRVVLAAGRKSVSVALWIRRQSNGFTRLVHVNRPWAPLSWFDLVVTTPQYGLPEHHNVVANLMPVLARSPAEASLPAMLQLHAERLPRPWTVVLLGGNSRPFALDKPAAEGLAAHVNADLRATGGSAWIVASPRTPAIAVETLRGALTVPHHVAAWGEGPNPYPALRVLGDRFVVTNDSVTMLAEALVGGRPVHPFALTLRPDLRWRVAAAWRQAAEHWPSSWLARSFGSALELGMLASVRDFARLQAAYEEAGMFADPARPAEEASAERQHTRARIEALLVQPA